MNPPNVSLPLPHVSRLGLLDTKTLRLLRCHISSTLSETVPFLASTFSFHAFDSDPAVHPGEVVFLAACLAIMVGCGLLSSLLQRRRSAHSIKKRRARHARDSHKGANGTVTSSDEDGYESSGSWQHVDESRHKNQESPQDGDGSQDALNTDPGLLRKHSTYMSYTTSVAEYPSIRTFYCPHPQMDKFPTQPSPIPLLVFVHGLGGSLAQFNHLLTSLSNIGPCFGIDLPGCGLSTFAPTSWDAYKVEALAELLATAIDQHRDKDAGQKVVLIGHSLGCSLSAMLASSASPIKSLREHVVGLVAVCPRALPPSPKEVSSYRRLLYIPGPIFDLWRQWDRRGGLNSSSVSRLVGANADRETRGLQIRYNKQSKTPVWRRMAWGTLPSYTRSSEPIGGLPGKEVWAGVHTPVLLVAGESDTVNRPAELQKILKFFGDAGTSIDEDADGSTIVPDASESPKEASEADTLAHEEKFGIEPQEDEKTLTNSSTSVRGKRSVKTVILPAPASHALLYDRATYRTLAGIIQDFVSQYSDHRLNLGWQLQHLNTSGKWDVKNLAKWQKVPPVSDRIADTFVALKMLREVDEEHNPVLFSQAHRDKIYAVIDISHEAPVYKPESMEAGGIHYVKYPTVSKVPPTPDEVRDFVALVDRLQKEITEKTEKSCNPNQPRPVVGVHCHYGFNRTGFLIVSYLIERCGFGVQQAIDEFERRRPPGIRHGHFIDTLFVRYCVGLKRAPTL